MGTIEHGKYDGRQMDKLDKRARTFGCRVVTAAAYDEFTRQAGEMQRLKRDNGNLRKRNDALGTTIEKLRDAAEPSTRIGVLLRFRHALGMKA